MSQQKTLFKNLFLSASAVTVALAGINYAVANDNAETAEIKVQIDEVKIISRQDEIYHGWPTLTKLKSGELMLVWSGGREAHVCPFGRVDSMRSGDMGKTWSWPRTLLDSAIDDRDAGVLETKQGTLLATTFTSLAYQPILDKAQAASQSQRPIWDADRLQSWQSVNDRLSAEQRQQELGQWMIRSTDGGLTWSKRYPSVVNSPHGPIELTDGRLLYAGVRLWDEDRLVGICISEDDGATWNWGASIPTRPGDDHKNYHELPAVEASSGRIIVHIRNHNVKNNREILQTESDDGGKSWSTPHAIGIWGLPSFLTRLADNRLLVTYGYRRKPYGIRASISQDDGKTWAQPFVLTSDATNGDLGYPSTVQFDDGSLLTVWYEKMAGQQKACLRQAAWRFVDSE